jgi:hypothetical protein
MSSLLLILAHQCAPTKVEPVVLILHSTASPIYKLCSQAVSLLASHRLSYFVPSNTSTPTLQKAPINRVFIIITFNSSVLQNTTHKTTTQHLSVFLLLQSKTTHYSIQEFGYIERKIGIPVVNSVTSLGYQKQNTRCTLS